MRLDEREVGEHIGSSCVIPAAIAVANPPKCHNDICVVCHQCTAHGEQLSDPYERSRLFLALFHFLAIKKLGINFERDIRIFK
jgi:hypothetical protein